MGLLGKCMQSEEYGKVEKVTAVIMGPKKQINQNLACICVDPNSVVWQISSTKYQPVVLFYTMTLHCRLSLIKHPLNVNEHFSFVLFSRVSVAVHCMLHSSLSFLITMTHTT